MHKPFFFLAFVFSLSFGEGWGGAYAQENLVLNPSLEDTASMGDGWPYLITSNWLNPNGSTADYFSPFDEELGSGSGSVLHAPQSQYLGYQVAQDGQAYLGLDIYESTGPTKEYAQGFLSEPLLQSVTYCVSIWVNLSDKPGLQRVICKLLSPMSYCMSRRMQVA
ncbi:MAG: hypothetical protein SH856_02720 [Flavobacteriales bacterium]|nr:hypothetical protein [Flavobacteriales bacterium]